MLKYIFENIPKDDDISILTSCCYFEIYNEKIVDLLRKFNK